MKRCCTCKEEKALTDFGKNRAQPDGYQKRCLSCSREASSRYYLNNKDKASAAVKKWATANKEKVYQDSQSWRRANPDKIKEYRRRQNLKYRGLTEDSYALAYASQQGKCAICGGWQKVLAVDHNHSCCTGNKSCDNCRRGLLCSPCNTGIGLLKDSPTVLLSAANYLMRYAMTKENDGVISKET